MACVSCGERAKERKALAKKTNKPISTSSKTSTTASVTPVIKGNITVDGTTYKGVKSQLKAPVDVVSMNKELRKQARKDLIKSRRKFGNGVKLVKRVDDKEKK